MNSKSSTPQSSRKRPASVALHDSSGQLPLSGIEAACSPPLKKRRLCLQVDDVQDDRKPPARLLTAPVDQSNRGVPLAAPTSTSLVASMPPNSDDDHTLNLEFKLKQQSLDLDKKVAANDMIQIARDKALAESLQKELHRTDLDKKVAARDMIQIARDKALAESLQKELRHQTDLDKKVAARDMVQVARDKALAESLQKKLHQTDLDEEAAAMKTTTSGRALLFVQAVIDMIQKLPPDATSFNFDTVAQDDMVHFTEKMLNRQADFACLGKPTNVDIGFHYTKAANMSSIRKHGLMTLADRQRKGIKATFNGARFGDGIYTANDPLSSEHFGDAGVMVLRLQGNVTSYRHGSTKDVDTNIGRKGQQDETRVLTSSEQCTPVIRYKKSALFNSNGSVDHRALERLDSIRCKLQKLADDMFNAGSQPATASTGASFRFGATGPALSGTNSAPVAPSATAFTASSNIPVGPATFQFGSSNNGGPVVTANSGSGGLFGPPRNGFANNSGLFGSSASSSLPSPGHMSVVSWSTTGLNAASASSTNQAKQNVHHSKPSGGGQTLKPPPTSTSSSGSAVTATEVLCYVAPERLDSKADSLFQIATKIPSSQCTICHDFLTGNEHVVTLNQCGHLFHKDCFVQALAYSNKCPTCRTALSEPKGHMPSGTMTVDRSRKMCSGHEPAGTIVINYQIKSGAQKSYHPNPGVHHGSAHRTAYIPDVPEGQKLLARLKYAFLHGLTFSVGRSVTTGQDNVVTWSSIHHKTSRNSGAHGYPDAGYFVNSNKELDDLGVPSAEDCNH